MPIFISFARIVCAIIYVAVYRKGENVFEARSFKGSEEVCSSPRLNSVRFRKRLSKSKTNRIRGESDRRIAKQGRKNKEFKIGTEVIAMKKQMSMLIFFFVLFLALGCAPGKKRQVAEPPPHSHYFPFTQVIGDYHLRLIVDHADGDMALVFEDFAERPIKPVECTSIQGKATLPDGRVEELRFRADTTHGKKFRHRYYTRRSTMPRECGIFTAKGEWIKKTPAFTLEVIVPLMGERHERTFKYEAPGGEVPYHRR